jgi:hypothetical protein
MAKPDQVKRALELYCEEIGQKENVVGLGRVPSEKGSGEWDLAVYVRKKLPEAEIAAADRVPKMLEIPGKKEKVRVKTQVIEQGEVMLEPGG